MKHQSAYYKGIAMVEVLITTVITAIGILAVLLLVNNLKSSSLVSKQRVEALSLAISKIESLQNISDFSEYLAITSGKDKLIVGKTAKFNRSWEVMDLNKPQSKVIKLKLSWRGSHGDNEQLQLNNIISWNNPIISASIASYGVDSGFTYLSPNQNIHLGDQKQLILADDSQTIALPYQMKKYRDSANNIYILDENNSELLRISVNNKEAEPKLFEISGKVYYQGELSTNLRLIASNSAYCRFPIEEQTISGTHWNFAKYYCITAQSWKGKIGIINADQQQNRICPDRSREYLHYGLLQQKLTLSGISQNYNQQDFIVDDFTNDLANGLTCAEQSENLQSLAGVNLVNAENHTIMTSTAVKNISGRINYNANIEISRLDLAINNTSYDCRVLNKLDKSNDAYSCVIDVENPTQDSWAAELVAKVYSTNIASATCEFVLPFTAQTQSTILDLDLNVLCSD